MILKLSLRFITTAILLILAWADASVLTWLMNTPNTLAVGAGIVGGIGSVGIFMLLTYYVWRGPAKQLKEKIG